MWNLWKTTCPWSSGPPLLISRFALARARHGNPSPLLFKARSCFLWGGGCHNIECSYMHAAKTMRSDAQLRKQSGECTEWRASARKLLVRVRMGIPESHTRNPNSPGLVRQARVLRHCAFETTACQLASRAAGRSDGRPVSQSAIKYTPFSSSATNDRQGRQNTC